MDLTESFSGVLPASLLALYEVREVRRATEIIAATSPNEFAEILKVLSEFKLTKTDITDPGGSKSHVARRLDEAFRKLGWREGRHDIRIVSELKRMPYRAAGETKAELVKTSVLNEGYKVDNVKRRIALDIEWNAKDGNLDRDLAAYRALYDSGIITAGVIITRTQDDLRRLAKRLKAERKFGTTTTTNLLKLEPRLTRGDGGGCPILAIAITARCYSA